MEVEGLEHLPATGPTVLMMNHMAFIDPVVVTASVQNRYVIAMAKAETMKDWFPRLVVNLWGNFTVKRGEADRQAIQNSIALLQRGHLLLIAPEGTRNPETGLQAPKDGMAYILHKADALVVPTAVVGASDWSQRLKRWRRAYAHISFGRPFRFVLGEGERLNREIRQKMMQEAMYQLARTIPDSYADKRGCYQDLSRSSTHYLHFV